MNQDQGTAVAVEYERDGAAGGMTKRDAAVLAVRVMGVFWAMAAAQHAAYLAGHAWQLLTIGRVWTLSMYGLPPVFYAVAGTLALARTDLVVRWVLPTFGTGEARVGAGARELQAVAFSVLGLWVLTNGAPELVRGGYAYAVERWTGRWSYAWVPQAAFGGAQVAVGLGLFLGARGLVVAWERVRTAGVRKNP